MLRYAHFFQIIMAYSVFLLLIGCKQDESVKEPKKVRLNKLAMLVNGQDWQPSQIGTDDCLCKFKGAWSFNGQNKNPYFTLSAFQDPQAETFFKNETGLNMQITNLQKPGIYYLAGSYLDHFESFAIFSLKTPEGKFKQYINKAHAKNFYVQVNELIPLPGTTIPGIAATFSGTLYNKDNPLDSLTFNRGSFTFKKVNWHNYNQCQQ
ncbi:DUF5025 domain-containing protein [Adhaeribacter aquaticus]|uniref:DUF5025 domain-containing protein n=1 Tax=Adhaeribacter aquaticus TaxID=299567 RepID=UPI00047BF7AC|nr:DUF5025 domain-containing protein [Adhaeribacter aquaticus]